MTTINDPALAEYADRLQAAGFTIYEPLTPQSYFDYSRVVDGKECFGYVQRGVGRYSHSMPIPPSREAGSNMWVAKVPDELSVEAARMVARPFNSNPLVGRRPNYRNERGLAQFRRRGGAT